MTGNTLMEMLARLNGARWRRSGFGVRQWLILSFGVVIGLLLLLAAGALWQTHALGVQIERIVDGNNRRSDLAYRLNAAQLDLTGQLRALLLLSDPEDLKAQTQSLKEAQGRYAQFEGALATSLLDASADTGLMRTQLAAVQELREAVTPVHEVVARTMLNGAGLEAALTLLLPIERAEAQWRQQITAIVTSVAEANRAEFDAARKRQHIASLGIGGTAAVAVLVALLAATGLIRRITRPVADAVMAAECIAEGRLDGAIDVRRRDEFGRLSVAMATMQQRLRITVQALHDSSTAVHGASDEISTGSLDLSERTEHAVARLQQTTSTLNQLKQGLAASVDAAREASGMASQASRDAQQGDATVVQLSTHMTHIANASRRITEIVTAIDSIAFQTNILALNAAVEAAHAGEQGRGFAVVASEVRQLARRAAEAAGQIRELSAQTASSIARGEASVTDAGDIMTRLVAVARNVAHTVEGIADTTTQQRTILSHIDETVLLLDSATQQNAALAEQLSVAATNLQGQAVELVQVVSTFHLGDAPGAERPRVELSASLPVLLTT